MTGEITLSGRVLPVGGIKEKVLAARRHGITEVILPRQNEKNIKEDLTEELRRELTIHYVAHMEEVLAIALMPSSSQTHSGLQIGREFRRRCSRIRFVIRRFGNRGPGIRRFESRARESPSPESGTPIRTRSSPVPPPSSCP